MPPKPASKTHRNRILAALAPRDLELLAPHLERRDITLGHVFEEPNRPIRHVYFIERGFASVVASLGNEHRVEVGLIGREGVSGIPVLFGDDRSPHHCYAQLGGTALRMKPKPLQDAMNASPGLRKVLLSFAQTFMMQTAQTALANGRAKVEERLARWILMAHDRIDGNDLGLTHEFLSVMLGVRRAGVTVALRELERRALVRGNRGRIMILDRAGLEATAGRSYGVAESEYRRLLG